MTEYSDRGKKQKSEFQWRNSCPSYTSHKHNWPLSIWLSSLCDENWKTPLYVRKNGVYRGIHIFFIVAQKHRLCSNMHIQTMFEEKKNIMNYHLENAVPRSMKYTIILYMSVQAIGQQSCINVHTRS